MLFVQSVIPHDVVKNGTYSRKLIFLTIGEQNCVVQKYKCNKMWSCNYTLICPVLLNGNANYNNSM